MYTLDKNDYDDVLDLASCCAARLKDSGRVESLLSEMLKSFNADEAVFLSASNNNEGVNLANSCVLCKDKAFLTQYADYYWRYDPLYQKQFCPTPSNPVFKTDDVIPFSQMVKLEYYNAFLRPQNLLGELIIRLYSKDSILGAISLQRYQEHPCFGNKDVLKASILVPYLVNILEVANRLIKINDERELLEQWLESSSEGIILLDSEFKPMYLNSKARLFCLILSGGNKERLDDVKSIEISIPPIIIQDCKKISRPDESHSQLQGHSNRIVNTKHNKRYYLQYFPIILPSSEHAIPHFIVFLNELTKYNDNIEQIVTEQVKLSSREEVIAQYAALGLSNKQIAEKLDISPFTVQNHLKSIFEKTGLDCRTKLANIVKYSDHLLF